MKSRVLVAVGLSAALLGTAACGPDKATATSPSSGASASGAASTAGTGNGSDAKTTLEAAMLKAAGTSSDYTISTTEKGAEVVHGAGAVDPAKKLDKASLTTTAAGKSFSEQVLIIGGDLYLKLDLPLPGLNKDKWIHLGDSSSGILKSLGMSNPSDPAGLARFNGALVDVKQTAPGQFSGTYDATKSTGGALASTVLSGLGDQAKHLAFTATVANGYLTSLTSTVPAFTTSAAGTAASVPASTTVVSFSDFGKAVSADKPAASMIQEASPILQAALKALGG